MAHIAEVDLAGDVSLLVVNNEGRGFRVLVSKATLCFSSEYFITLFDEDSAEGAMETDGEIKLPDDNPNACLLLLKMLHNYPTSAPPHAKELVALGKTAKSYGCVDALRLSTSFLFSAPPAAVLLPDYAVAAYLLDDAAAFQKYTEALILQHRYPYLPISVSPNGSMLPAHAWIDLEAQRSTAYKQLLASVLRLQAKTCSDVICDAMKSWYITMAYNCHTSGLADAGGQSVSAVLEKARNLIIPREPRHDFDCLHGTLAMPVSHATFQRSIDAIAASCRGLCLDCVREGGQNHGVCRIPHA